MTARLGARALLGDRRWRRPGVTGAPTLEMEAPGGCCGYPGGASRISGSPDGQTARILEVLNRAWLRVTAARLQVADLQSGVAAASRALSRAEMQTRGALLEAHPPRAATAARLQAAAHEMGSVARRCHRSADVGITIAGETKKASLLVEEVHATIRGIELDGLDAQEVSDLAVLAVRVDALGDLLSLALPMATAASENLYDAAHLARQVEPRAPGEPAELGGPALLFKVDAATARVALVGRALGRAEQDSRHLGRTLEQAESIGHQVVGRADLINQAAKAPRRVLPGPGPFTYPQVLDLTMSEALRLGVEGTGPDANQVRRERDASIIDQQKVASDQAYLTTTWPKEPFVPEPTMAHILVRNDGDMSRAVQDPQILEQVIEELGSTARRTDSHDVKDDPARSTREPFDPLLGDRAGWRVVRDAVDALRRGVGVGPITDVEFEHAASSGARAADPASVTSPHGHTDSFDTSARDRLNSQSRDASSRPATARPPAPGR